MKTPYLSIVATTRNDNHGGDLIKRTTCFVNGIYHQAQKFKVDVELIIVEWNPPKNKALLKDVLPPPPKGCSVSLRYIVVPHTVHEKYKMATRMPLFQMTAKNAGIRRARGSFILCTNIDLLFSNELFSFFAEKKLSKNVFYRANRVDVTENIMENDDVEKQLSFAEKNIIARLGKRKGQEYLDGMPNVVYFFTTVARLINTVIKLVIFVLKSKEEFIINSLDTSACGDFTLMHKEDWLKMEGYPELDLYSIHIDSMGIIAAKALGLQQNILPPKMCSYHIYHKDGWESFKETPVDLIRFIEKRPGLDWSSVYITGKWMIKNKRGWEFNNSDWGFVNENFKEYIFESGKEMQELN